MDGTPSSESDESSSAPLDMPLYEQSEAEASAVADRPYPVSRSAISQTALLGVICFCVPGMWNAITSMAGGIADTSVSSNATASLYACFTICSLVAPIAINMLGPRPALFVGSLGYIAYVAALLLLDLSLVPPVVVILAGAANGVGAGLLWTAQGGLMMSYPTTEEKGKHVALFWVIFNSGAVVGGFLTFGLNVADDPHASQASPATFLAFGGIMCLGAALTFCLAHPAAVVRPDGSRVRLSGSTPLRAEVLAMLTQLRNLRIAALLPLFIYSNWFYAVQFSCFNTVLFTKRTQGLNNAGYWAAQMVGATSLGLLLDWAPLPLRSRARAALLLTALLMTVSWGLGLLAASHYRLDAGDASSRQLIDITSTGSWAAPFALYLLWGLCDSFIQCYVYWLLGQLQDRPEMLSRAAGLFKGLQSAGAAVSWALSSHSWAAGGVGRGAVPPSTQMWTCLWLLLLSLPGGFFSTSALSASRSRRAPVDPVDSAAG